MKKKILIILGPTASGKSDLAVRLAKKFNGEVISADSRQVYKGLNIGTGKITKREKRGVPHHLINVAEPKKRFSVSDFLLCTNQAIAEIVQKDKLPIVAGGTGFYIDAIAGKVVLPEVPPNKKLRERLAKKSNSELFNLLRKKDHKRAEAIDMHNKVRLIRALEIVEALGKVPQIKVKPSSNFIYIGLKPDDLDERIRERLNKRLAGMLQEGKRLHAQGLSYKRMNELGLEYRYIAMFLQGKLDKEEMKEKLYKEIRKYAKRQMTWFKVNKRIKWFKPEQYGEVEKYARIALKGD
jgi:tRNA dimethylallyltransferase